MNMQILRRKLMEKKLTVAAILKEGVGIGMKNLVPILVNALLWILTVWIPYLNVGTTIGLVIGIVAKASKGEAISMTEIFDPKYRKYMGEFFLTHGLVIMGVTAGFMLFIIPGIVIAIAWSLALLFAVDKEISPVDAISKSNKATYGSKATIFGANVVLYVVVAIIAAIFIRIPGIGPLLSFAVYVAAIFVSVGMQAYVYKILGAAVK